MAMVNTSFVWAYSVMLSCLPFVELSFMFLAVFMFVVLIVYIVLIYSFSCFVSFCGLLIFFVVFYSPWFALNNLHIFSIAGFILEGLEISIVSILKLTLILLDTAFIPSLRWIGLTGYIFSLRCSLKFSLLTCFGEGGSLDDVVVSRMDVFSEY